jgi:RNA polymerase primary sigma factor
MRLEVQRAGFGRGQEFFGCVKLPDLLTQQQEVEAAKHFEEMEVGYWASLLSYLPAFEVIAKVVLTEVYTKAVTEVPRMRKLLPPLKTSRSKVNTDNWGRLASSLASKLRTLDSDRLLVAKANLAVQQLAAGKTKGTRAYLARVDEARAKVQKAKNQLVVSNLRLVVLVATKYKQGALSHEDLVQEGTLGLIKAVERFDYTKGNRFSTYATWWIRKYVSLAVSKGDLVRVPKEVSSAHRYVPFEERFTETLEDTPSDETSDGVKASVRKMLDSLPPRETKALTLYFGLGDREGVPLSAVGRRLKVSSGRARQIKESALSRIRRIHPDCDL